MSLSIGSLVQVSHIVQPMNITFGPPTPYRFPCILLSSDHSWMRFANGCVVRKSGWHLLRSLQSLRHTLPQISNYRLTSIAGTIGFEFNSRRRAHQNADHTSGNSAPDEFGQLADVAAQPRVGLLPERRPGLGRRNTGRFVTSWKNLR